MMSRVGFVCLGALVGSLTASSVQDEALYKEATSNVPSTDRLRELLASGANAEGHTSPTGASALMKVCNAGNVEAVQALSSHANPNHVNKDGNTALMLAVQGGFIEIVRLLISSFTLPIDVNIENKDGTTALLVAGLKGSHEAAKMLIAAGAGHLADSEGLTALMAASNFGHVETVRLLLTTFPADISRKMNAGGETALILAATEGQADVVRELLQHGADANEHTSDGVTALMMGISSKNATHVVSALLIGGADANARDQNNLSALISCCFHDLCTEAALAMLLHAGADVNTQENSTGATPLIAASAAGSGSKLKLLLRASPAPRTDTADQKNNTALSAATESTREILQAYAENRTAWLEQARKDALRVQTHHDRDFSKHLRTLKAESKKKSSLPSAQKGKHDELRL